MFNLIEAQGEAANLAGNEIFRDRLSGPGLDLAVLQEKLVAAKKLLFMLTAQGEHNAD